MPKITFDFPNTQVDFAGALLKIRELSLQNALYATVASMEIGRIDGELRRFVDNEALQLLASRGLRGELLFAVPAILEKQPMLLGYYRLLLGYSQKAFYTTSTGAGIFKSLEEKGQLSSKQCAALPDLCVALNINAQYLLSKIPFEAINAVFFDHLTLLTLGAQLRGGVNVRKGASAISDVFDIIFQIVKPNVVDSNSRQIQLINKSERNVYIQFAADPDIVVKEELLPGFFKNLVAIEVKGGQDYSNIHNRIGEAEKSHQKAKQNGFVECWTVINVNRIDMQIAARESPTTNKFFRISELRDNLSDEHQEFALQISSIVGI